MTKDKKYKLLFIDDDTFISDMYALKFSNEGHNLVVANSVDEALDKLREGNDYDAIATDLIMPGKDGFAFLEQARMENLLGDSVIIVLSNQDEPEVKTRFKELGAVEHIVKAHALPNEVLKITVNAIEKYGKK
jgi:CheY-like chemotaxis protein